MIKPFGKNILIEPIEKKQILISERKSLCEYGKVIDIGEDVKYIKVGDTVGYTVWGVNHLEVDDKRYYFIPETDEFILGTFQV